MPAGGPHPTRPPRVERLERFALVGSTQDVVRDWLAAGEAEICVAVADEQSAGRGRLGRRWLAPPGRALLLSAGFRPASLPVEQGWRIPALGALAMLDAASALLGREAQGLALKWPNDIVVVRGGRPRKVGGVLAEAVLTGGALASVVVGLGTNVNWPASAFPAHLGAAMSSLSEAGRGPVDRELLLQGWLERLEAGYAALAEGRFEADRWAGAQATTGASVSVRTVGAVVRGTAVGVDRQSGDLLLEEAGTGRAHRLSAGEVLACRLHRSAPRL